MGSYAFDSTHFDLNANLKRYLDLKENKGILIFINNYLDTSNYGEKYGIINNLKLNDKNTGEKRKGMLDKIFITPVENISNELEKDLTGNGVEDIIKRQMIRKVRPEFWEFFENVSTAPYSLRNWRK